MSRLGHPTHLWKLTPCINVAFLQWSAFLFTFAYEWIIITSECEHNPGNACAYNTLIYNNHSHVMFRIYCCHIDSCRVFEYLLKCKKINPIKPYFVHYIVVNTPHCYIVLVQDSAIGLHIDSYCNMVLRPKRGFNKWKDIRFILFCSCHCKMTSFVQKWEREPGMLLPLRVF